MEKLSPLSIKCLAHMQMILDSLAVSIETLKSVITPCYNEFEKLIEKNCFPLGYINSEEYEYETIYTMGHNDNYKYRHLEEIIPEIELLYCLPFEQTKKRNPLKFQIMFGYICEEVQNVIYFQLSEESEKISILSEDFSSELSLSIPNEWRTGIIGDSIFVEFTVDENLSGAKINECANTFKTYILLPFFNKLRS